MVRTFLIVGALLFLSPNSSLFAGEFNPTLNIGDISPCWENLQGVSGESHSLSDYNEYQVIILVFTSNTCPYSGDYERRINQLVRHYENKSVAVIAVNSNSGQADALPAMKDAATEKNFLYPYVSDDSQDVARDYGVTYTPEFFVLDRNRIVTYMGAMDDSPDETKVEKNYVRLAVDAALVEGKPDVTETVAIGCRVRYKRIPRLRE